MTDPQFQALMERLAEIRNLLFVAVEGPVHVVESTDPPVCDHPADQRIDLSTFGRVGFACRACHYQEVIVRPSKLPESKSSVCF